MQRVEQGYPLKRDDRQRRLERRLRASNGGMPLAVSIAEIDND